MNFIYQNSELFARATATVGESPVWDGCGDRLWWTDLARGRLLAHDADGRLVYDARLGSTLGAVVLREGGGLTAALDGRVVAIDAGNDRPRVRPLADLGLAGRPLRVNDAACDPNGRLWVGVVGTAPQRAPGELHVLEDGRTRRVLDGLAFPNGFDWSPDGAALYLVESHARRVRVHPFDAASGELGDPAEFVQLPPEDGLPDGVAVDAEGGVWVAVWGAGEVRRYTPAGTLAATVACPASQTSSCAFGGPDRRTL
ncbi:MAG TPA: SMP-30/gluconolactonase/LRE family protein, partial [Conexibacter sp.]